MAEPDITKIEPPEKLYKYVSAETARLILANGTLRWASPFAFNDPFDMQWSPGWQLHTEQAKEAIQRRGIEMAKGTDDLSHIIPERRSFLEKTRQVWPLNPQFVVEQFRAMAERIGPQMATDLAKLIDSRLSELRILCLSQQQSSILMWSHYGKDHRGALLELDGPRLAKCSGCYAVEIEYVKSFPSLVDTDNLALQMFSGGQIDELTGFMDKLVRCKWIDWQYEKEIRLIHRYADPSGGLETYPVFEPSCLRSITIGCRTLPSDAKEIRELASRKFPSAEICKAKLGPIDFAVESEPCK